MQKVIIIILTVQISVLCNSQLIADHTIVDKYDDIPQVYLEAVKKMWLVVAGESHSGAYRNGLDLLEAVQPAYDVNITNGGVPEAYTTSHLRTSNVMWGDYENASGWMWGYGEEDWWTNTTALSRTKAGISYCNSHSLTISALGFGWCWDPYGTSHVSSGTDPVYGCHWYGWSVGSPDGDWCWGIDDADNSVSGNSVNIDSYIEATQEYINYCTTNNIPTKVFFTTGPVDDLAGYAPAEARYQAHLKYERIRDYVESHPTTILFDYADILCYDDNGQSTTTTWNGKTFPIITSTNGYPETTGHISDAGALRLAKAMWWMLARIAGWDGGTTGIAKSEEDTSSPISIGVTKTEIKILLNGENQSSSINLYNLSGSLVDGRKTYSNYCVLNISHLPSGVYIIVVSSPKGSKTQKVVIS